MEFKRLARPLVQSSRNRVELAWECPTYKGNPPHIPQPREVERLCSPGQMLLWGETAQGHIRAVVIVVIYTHVLKVAAGGTASPLDSLLPIQ